MTRKYYYCGQEYDPGDTNHWFYDDCEERAHRKADKMNAYPNENHVNEIYTEYVRT